MNTLKKCIKVHKAYMNNEISFENYLLFFREPGPLLLQYLLLQLFLVLASLYMGLPLFMIVWASLILLYGVAIQSGAHSVRSLMIRASIWAITSFILSVLYLFIAIEYLHLW